MSRIGRKPIVIPEGVKVKREDSWIIVDGPKGSLKKKFEQTIDIELSDSEISVVKRTEDKKQKALQGLVRSLINNMIIGVSHGFSKTLEIRGVGYRAALKGRSLQLNLGYSNPIDFSIPDGIELQLGATPEKNTRIDVKGIDKELVGSVAAKIRGFRSVEPYKGKGIRYVDEVVRIKEGKVGA